MNRPANLFRSLDQTFQMDAAGQHVDALAAELASEVGASLGPLCLGLVHKEAVPRFYGLVFLLDHYGPVLRHRYRRDGLGAFVFVERKRLAVSEFEGAQVREVERAAVSDKPVTIIRYRSDERPPVLPRAA